MKVFVNICSLDKARIKVLKTLFDELKMKSSYS